LDVSSDAVESNMLALSASIEADRAGEATPGFTAVAGEVKGLAQQAQGRATEIAATVKEIRATADQTID
jgi:methyl-accepting chemotaxis protein